MLDSIVSTSDVDGFSNSMRSILKEGVARSEASRDETEGSESGLAIFVSGRMEVRGNGRFDDLANEFSGK